MFTVARGTFTVARGTWGLPDQAVASVDNESDDTLSDLPADDGSRQLAAPSER